MNPSPGMLATADLRPMSFIVPAPLKPGDTIAILRVFTYADQPRTIVALRSSTNRWDRTN